MPRASAMAASDRLSPLNTYGRVRQMMRKSSHGEALRTYHSSSAVFSSTERSLPPLTCAHPVIPGRTESRKVGSEG